MCYIKQNKTQVRVERRTRADVRGACGPNLSFSSVCRGSVIAASSVKRDAGDECGV